MELNGVRVSRETQGRLQHFAELFQKWAKTINLVAPSTVDDLWRRHIADSAQIFQLHPKPARWVDLGSGGGFPGIITAILLAEQKDGHVDLVESNQKKAAFLRVCLRECEARGAVHAVRIEEAPKIVADCDVISARALAELDMLLDYAAPWVERNENLRLLLHKGRDYEREVHKARGRWEFDLVKHNSVVESDSVILELTRPRRRI
ncbi:16S rRNA (guanine(527)-N(7))-methyltransferase RsmG [Agrobacterium rhizogenes]|uniref:Ribosomal RNA small subunit methyltransferase G n=1 Tax=Rhizobium rhizogenes (strain K84 / ATCC BAA-868) TaxID=311403 RepID=RSMG_RHIR8|nr:16S rRNA (guanine(527)-N(7))-methyltransferase RsmG [Rhizobium rhizogenes]B9JEW2.1 RecName: Full=Ribosomal RNA small subunit methyltransferase G; AltName: Full=16S rRNA 7-methylguanosine methyltransferase; Short=16S rRNA m7G methyltransferase [Rhizobium rhizogenes K84]OCJ23946.1 16S rRNA methyltransferase G [Agrobacterium sp. B131/95]ACM28531.1 glucose inhibited division protein B [Rhizobium rhizogenes K84]NTF70153.1 16S rRNA (guanine(527)-N(7))-methyltransferase RsmG [Rhizobium rhizogenes]